MGTATADIAEHAPPPAEVAAPSAAWKPKTNPWLIAATVALAAFMEVLDTSIANVALPHISGSLGASPDQGTWVLTSYLVANAIVLPIGGWASSVIGRKNFFLLCIVIFTVSSFLCGIAPTLPLLLIFRVMQGAGGGGLQPMAQAIMADSFEPKDRGLAFSLYGLVAVLAPSIGPTLGGWITDNYSWNWIFYINIPVGVLAVVLVSRLVEDPPWLKADRRNLFSLDYVGLGLLTVSMGALQIMLDKGEENDWFQSNFIRFFGFTFVVAIISLLVWEWQHKKPIMNLRLFQFRNFATCAFLMTLTGGILNASTVLQPQFLQSNLGYTATVAGLSLSAGGIVLVMVMPIAGIAVGRFQARYLIAIGFSFFAISYFYTGTHLSNLISFKFASILRVIQIFPIPLAFISITTAAYFGLPKEASNQVAGLINFVRNIGGSIFIAITGAMVTQRSMAHENFLQNHMLATSPGFASQVGGLTGALAGTAGQANAGYLAQAQVYNELQQQASALGYVDVYLTLAIISALMVPLAFLLRPNNPGGGGAVMME